MERMSEQTKARLNARIEACYFEQIIDEACNADFGFNNNFRRTMTVRDCIEAQRHSEMWERVAEFHTVV